MAEKEQGLYQYKAFFTDGTHSYLYFYKKLHPGQLSRGWISDDDGEFINLANCKGIRLMHEPEGITNE